MAFDLQLLYNRIIINYACKYKYAATAIYVCVCVKVKEADKDNENLCNVPVDGEL